jgi:hypothetical protein
VDAVTEIRVGERVAWSGHVTGSTTILINNPNLFGGEVREGGVQGAVDILMGEARRARAGTPTCRVCSATPSRPSAASSRWS